MLIMGRDLKCDVAIVGGGLAGGLIAYALSVKRPDLRIRLIERDATLGGNHVWSFFSTDVAPQDRWIVEPFVSHQWLGYQVRFPAHRRTLGAQYNSIRSKDFDAVLREKLPEGTIVHAAVKRLGPTTVVLANGTSLSARGVIDARGAAHLSHFKSGWQKFVGQEYRTATPHGLTQPIVMDATVDQIDGYRFVYALPFGEDRIFVEDTYYSDSPHLDPRALRQRLAAYTDAQGWSVAEVLSEEQGVLPVVLGGNFEAFWSAGIGGVGKAGARGALFHPTTGYSLPDAVRAAAMIADMPDLSGAALHDALKAMARGAWKSRGFYRMLDRMLFLTVRPEHRYRIMERFYRLRPPLIERFYAGKSTLFDRLRILTGRPPVPIHRALKVVREK